MRNLSWTGIVLLDETVVLTIERCVLLMFDTKCRALLLLLLLPATSLDNNRPLQERTENKFGDCYSICVLLLLYAL